MGALPHRIGPGPRWLGIPPAGSVQPGPAPEHKAHKRLGGPRRSHGPPHPKLKSQSVSIAPHPPRHTHPPPPRFPGFGSQEFHLLFPPVEEQMGKDGRGYVSTAIKMTVESER